MMDESKLISKVHEKSNPVFMKSKSEIIDYYRDTYGKNWTSKAAEKLSGTTDKRSHEYKAAIRQFQGSRINQAGPQLAPKFESVGKQLPPSSYTPKGNMISVTVSGSQADGKGGSRSRSFSTTLTGSDAYAFVNKPSFREFFKSLGYPDHVIDLLESGEYALEVSTVA